MQVRRTMCMMVHVISHDTCDKSCKLLEILPSCYFPQHVRRTCALLLTDLPSTESKFSCKLCGSVFRPDNHSTRFRRQMALSKKIRQLRRRASDASRAHRLGKFQRHLLDLYENRMNQQVAMLVEHTRPIFSILVIVSIWMPQSLVFVKICRKLQNILILNDLVHIVTAIRCSGCYCQKWPK